MPKVLDAGVLTWDSMQRIAIISALAWGPLFLFRILMQCWQPTEVEKVMSRRGRVIDFDF